MGESFRSGYVSLIGRPNVGKSTLLNLLLGQKVSIVSAKPQTTRNRILGIRTSPGSQVIFLDTPGIHKPKNLLGQSMVSTVRESMGEIDLILLVTEVGRCSEDDSIIIATLKDRGIPVFLVINKIDRVPRETLLGMIEEYSGLYPFKEIIPVSALKHYGTELLFDRIIAHLPAGPQYYPDDLVTDQLERFMAGEIIREKIMGKTSEEIPYSVAVEVVNWKERDDGIIAISANIYVEREGQKGIIIGDKGKMLKSIGTQARLDIERLLGSRVFLQLWVKVRKGWRDDTKALRELGYM